MGTRDPRSCSEEQIHCAVVALLRFRADRHTIWLHVPNGEYRSHRTGARLKRMGVIPGVADFLVVPPSGKACFLEIKTEKGRLSPEQRAFYERCIVAGIPYSIARSSKDAELILETWGALAKPRQELRRAA